MRFCVSVPLFAALLFTGTIAISSGASADDVVRFPVFPKGGGVMCCCPSQWLERGEGTIASMVCAVPKTIVRRWIRENNAKETQTYERHAAKGEAPQVESSHGIGGSGMTGGRGGYLGPCGAGTCQ